MKVSVLEVSGDGDALAGQRDRYFPRALDCRLPHLRLEDDVEIDDGGGAGEDEATRESSLAGV
jgi:hypothetical protein